MHITAIITDRDGQVEIPEEVLSAPVKSDDSDEFHQNRSKQKCIEEE